MLSAQSGRPIGKSDRFGAQSGLPIGKSGQLGAQADKAAHTIITSVLMSPPIDRVTGQENREQCATHGIRAPVYKPALGIK